MKAIISDAIMKNKSKLGNLFWSHYPDLKCQITLRDIPLNHVYRISKVGQKFEVLTNELAFCY